MNKKQLTVVLEYTRRYEDIAKGFPSVLRQNAGDFHIQQKDKHSEKVQLAVIQYINLCSEEFYLHSQKLVPEDVWALWSANIRLSFQAEVFRDAWAKLREQFSASPDFVEFIDGVSR